MASSKYADEGTTAHALAAMCLTEGTDAAAYIGRLIESEDYEHAKLSPSGAKKWMACPGSHALESTEEFVERCFSMEVTDDMAEYTQVYIDAVRQRVEEYKLAGAVEVILLVEQRLPIAHITGEEGATGTGDAVIIAVWADGTALVDVGDLKTGMGVVVSAFENPQLQIYGLGAIEQYGLLYEITKARLTIYQPRISREPSDWEISAEELLAFGEHAKDRAATARVAKEFMANWIDGPGYEYLTPGDHCRTSFCKVRATCPKLAAFVEEGVGADFEVIAHEAEKGTRLGTSGDDSTPSDDLATKMQAVDLIEDWCRAVRAEVERRLLAGQPVPGYKLVQGKRGARAWSDKDEAEKLMKSMRLKREEMYEFSLISPTAAEKIAPKYNKDGVLLPNQPDTIIKPKQWVKLKEYITQSDGKPSVAPESDKRPALVITPTEDDFDVVGAGEDLAG